MAQKLKWLFDEEEQTFSVDPGCEEYGKYGMLSFALTRCKDVMTHEEFLTVQSLYNGADNGSIQTSLDDLDKDLGKLKKYGVALSNLQFGYLKTEIDKVYLELDVVPVNTQTPSFSAAELAEVVETIRVYLKDGEFSPEDGKYYMPVKEFEELFDDSNISPVAIRKVLLEHGYIEGSNGRTSVLKKLDKKPVRMVAFKEDKFPE